MSDESTTGPEALLVRLDGSSISMLASGWCRILANLGPDGVLLEIDGESDSIIEIEYRASSLISPNLGFTVSTHGKAVIVIREYFDAILLKRLRDS